MVSLKVSILKSFIQPTPSILMLSNSLMLMSLVDPKRSKFLEVPLLTPRRWVLKPTI